MAEVLFVSAVSKLVAVLRESVQLQGARGLGLERAASGDTPSYQVPELPLNMCMVSELFVQILASGLGTLVLVFSTVVLLGHFSGSLQRADFWVITVIVFIQTTRIASLNVNPEAEYFNQVPPAFLELITEQSWGRGRPLTGQATGRNFWYYIMVAFGTTREIIVSIASVAASLALLILVVPLVAGLTCIALSIFRLVVLNRHHWSGINSADPRKENVMPSLIFLYALVLAQGGLFILWLVLMRYRFELADQVSTEYHFVKDKRQLIDKYIARTMSTSIKKGVLATINSNLVSFAADLIKSEYSEDRVSAVLVLHTLTSQGAHKARALSQIQSSPECIARLLDMVSSKSRIDQKTKISIAQIVAHLAGNLCLADISRATESITSLIDPYLTRISTPATGNGAESKPLIIHGLSILARLAGNPDNCTEIYNSMGLFSNIIAPISNEVYKIVSDDGTMMEITEKSLEVVSVLASGTYQTNIMIRQKIYEDGLAVKISSILTDDPGYKKLKVPATKIFTKLALDKSIRDTVGRNTVDGFINLLKRLFFNRDNDGELRKTAGKALAMLAIDSKTNCTTIMNSSTPITYSVVQQLIDMLKDANNVLYRTAIAQILTQFCANSSAEGEAERLRLQSVKTNLHEVLEIICDIAPEANINESDPPQHNQTPAQRALSFLFPCIDSSSFANRSNQGTTRGQPGRNQGAARTRHNQGPAQGILTQVLRYYYNLVISGRRNRNIHGDNCQNQPPPAQIGRGRIKTLAAFLGLTNEICDKLMISAHDFDTALNQIGLPRAKFVEKLKEIIEMCKGHSVEILEEKGLSADDYLVIIKTVTKLCSWVMRNNPGYIGDFDFDTALNQIGLPRDKFVEKLKEKIEMCEGHSVDILEEKDRPADDYPVIIKTVTKLCSCVMRNNPDYIGDFDFDTALNQIGLSRDKFVEKLKEIIEMCKGHSVDILEEKGRPADDYLVIIKTVTKLCSWVMRKNPDYIEDFNNNNIAEKLQHALKDMKELETAILLTGSADDVTNYETLSSIVQDATRILSQQHNV